MFPRNYSFLVRPVKEKPHDIVETSDPTKLVNAVTKGAATVVAVYLGCDTLRKIVVHTIATKIN